MELRVLGPFDAHEGGTPLQLGSPKARALLARLVIDANHAVPTSRLIDDLWGDEVPESAPKMVQIYVSHLRKVLPADVLLTRAPGYLVELDPEAIDLTRFMRLRDQGRDALAADDPAAASARFRDALGLWRGPALAEFSEPFAQVEGAHLDELRLSCLEDRITSDLALGLHGDLVGELEVLVAGNPLRETLQRSLMLALYRSGRQAEALGAYDRFRRALDDELGLEPSKALKALQHRILNQDPALDLRGTAPVAPVGPTPVAGAEPFIGREDELGLLEAALAAAAAGEGSAVLVSGPAGIGKTRLIEELTERARLPGARVLAGHCIHFAGGGLPYLPVVDALRPLRGSHVIEQLAGRLHELPRLLPDLLGDRTSPAPAAGGPEARLQLFEEVLAVLERLSEEAPLVLLLEDLHWADSSTLDLVAFLAHTAGSKRILLVMTARSGAVEAGDLQSLAVAPGVSTLQLDPLRDADIERLLSDRTSESPVPELIAGIAARAQGNPFFAGELLAAARRGETALPPRLRDVLLAGVARLDASTRGVLRLVAAVGRPVPYALLAAVAPLDGFELSQALRQATEHDLLVADQEALTFSFRHDLYGRVVYDTLLPGERELLHERLAAALTDNPQLAASRGAAEPAQHWAAAGRPVEALAASLQAAHEAAAVSGLAEALGHVERVLDLWDQVPGAGELAGIEHPSVLAWAVELAAASAPADNEADTCSLLHAVAEDELDNHALASRLRLSLLEARRLYPPAVVLESLAVRQSPPFSQAALDNLRAANARLRAARRDGAAAAAADNDFHRRLTIGCSNPHLLAALAPVKRALVRYERVYMSKPERVDRSVAEHDGIIAALARADHAEAAQRVRGNLAYGLDELRDVLEL